MRVGLSRRVRTLLCLLAAPCFLTVTTGCIDTELGLDVLVSNGTISVPQDESADIELLLDLNVRVGNFALNGNSFRLQRAGIFSGETAIAQLTLNRTSEFDARLEPGESVDVRLVGNAALSAFPNAASLCDAGSARVVVDYSADSVPDDPTDPPLMSLGTAEGSISVNCN